MSLNQLNQRNIRFTLPNPENKSKSAQKRDESAFNAPFHKSPPDLQFVAMLKRQCITVMRDITECPSVALPAHIARLDGLREVIEMSLRFWLGATNEQLRSERALLHPYTLADYLEALAITRQQHRCPVWVNDRDEQLAKIHAGIDRIAGLLANDTQIMSVLLERGNQ